MEKGIAIINGKAYQSDHVVKPNNGIIINNGKIIRIIQGEKFDFSDYRIIDAGENYILPGFIDVHVNGGGGHLAIEGTYEALVNMAIAHALQGTTSIVPTTISCEHTQLIKCLKMVADIKKENANNINILGIHLEGPFLNPQKAGAHKKQYLCNPSDSIFNKFYEAAEGNIKIISLAPELENSGEIIHKAIEKNIVVGLAHSEADYNQTCEAINKGMRLCTHIFNAMPPMTHRAPGPVGAFMTHSDTYTEIIADGYHVHPSVIEFVVKANGVEHTLLVTDAVSPAGTNIKSFLIDGIEMTVNGYSCFTKDGVLGGSALTLNRAVEVMMKNTSIPFEQIIQMVTETPAKMLKIFDRKGSIEQGKDADIIIVNSNMDVKTSIVNGTILQS